MKLIKIDFNTPMHNAVIHVGLELMNEGPGLARIQTHKAVALPAVPVMHTERNSRTLGVTAHRSTKKSFWRWLDTHRVKGQAMLQTLQPLSENNFSDLICVNQQTFIFSKGRGNIFLNE